MSETEAVDKKKLLLADDDLAMGPMTRQTLELSGYDVTLATDGEAALEKIREIKPDLILLDVKMPKLDGYQVCEEVKKDPALKHIPVLLLTVLDRSVDKVKGLNIGADDFINKPFDQSELIARVRSFLRTKHLYDQLQESYQRFQDLENLKEGLTSMIIHDLKSPLNVILGTLQFCSEIMREKGMEKQELKLMKNAEESCRHMNAMINDLLDVSRMEQKQLPLQKEKVRIAELMDAVVENMKYLGQQNKIQFVRNIDDKLPEIEIDRVLIERVLVNLISNSIKFMPGGGDIAVFARYLEAEKQMELGVEDGGTGIPEKYLSRIFEKFFQGEKLEVARKGQGLGLTFCRLAIEAHQGKIWAENRQEKGSRFILRLPA